jgi:hypothetical protein
VQEPQALLQRRQVVDPGLDLPGCVLAERLQIDHLEAALMLGRSIRLTPRSASAAGCTTATALLSSARAAPRSAGKSQLGPHPHGLSSCLHAPAIPSARGHQAPSRRRLQHPRRQVRCDPWQ